MVLSNSSVIVLHGPKAGRGQGREQLQRLEDLLRQTGRKVLVTSDLAIIEPLLGEPEKSILVAAGGDGTLSLAARLAMESETPILPMPMGTENLLARRLGYRPDATSVAASIEANQPRKIDAMSIRIGNRHHLSLVMATAGFDASVVRRVHLRRSGHIRRWTYAAPIVRSMIDYPFGEIVVEAEGHCAVTCRWAMVFNLAAYAGNLSIAPQAVPDDGKLDVVCFRGDSVINGLRYLAGVMTGRHERFADVTNLQTAKVSFCSEQRIPIQCDGDYAGRLPAVVECLPGAIRMIRPGL